MGIQVYNSLSNRKEPFEPTRPGKVGIYLCGPTVYKPSHIGHAVGPVIFDAIKRYLTFRGFEVTWVVNITDVEDKLIDEAANRKMAVSTLAAEVTKNYLEALDALGVTGIDRFPKASEHIGDILKIIGRLIDKGAAYESIGDVYFDVTADEDYGKLSNRSPEEQVGQRELHSGPKRHPGDFALWKAAKPDEPDEVKFESPWGMGRPGWHIECSAMAMKILGETFDIHGGGLDLVFPHHENEIAQSETCTGRPFAKYWMHNGLTRFNTKKVSKSDVQMQAALAQMTISNLLQKYSGELLRYFILSTHYRRPIEFSTAELESKNKGLGTFYRLFERVEAISGRSVYAESADEFAKAMACRDLLPAGGDGGALADDARETHERFFAAMDDDFNTAAAIATLFELANRINRFIEQRELEAAPAESDVKRAQLSCVSLMALGRLLGLFVHPPATRGAGGELVDRIMEIHLAVRSECREARQFRLADMIRDGLAQVGVTLEDKPTGTVWRAERLNDEKLIDALMSLHVGVRWACRSSKQFELADMIRDRLGQIGVTLEDRPAGTVWRVEPR